MLSLVPVCGIPVQSIVASERSGWKKSCTKPEIFLTEESVSLGAVIRVICQSATINQF